MDSDFHFVVHRSSEDPDALQKIVLDIDLGIS